MTRQAIETAGHYLKCDAPGCTHSEAVAAFFESDIGKPCPVCGSNLLTREDYEAAVTQAAVIDLLNEILEVPADADISDRQRVSLNPHEGDLHITIHRDDRAPNPDDRPAGKSGEGLS